jgi:hypothetical protein
MHSSERSVTNFYSFSLSGRHAFDAPDFGSIWGALLDFIRTIGPTYYVIEHRSWSSAQGSTNPVIA